MANSWNGRDNGLRRLRYLAFGVLSFLLVYEFIWGRHDLATIGTLLGAFLVLLGFEVGLRWPFGGREQ